MDAAPPGLVLTRRKALLAVAAALAVVVIVAFAVAAVVGRDSDDARVTAADQSEADDSSTTSTDGESRGGLQALPVPGIVTNLAHPVLPQWGLAVVFGDSLYLTDAGGTIVAGALANVDLGNYTAAEEPALVAIESTGRVRFRRSYLVNAETSDRTRQLEAVTPPAPPEITELVGHWAYALPSPDGRTWLAQWSGECEVPNAFFASPSGTDLRAVTGEEGTNWLGAPASVAVGWSPDGRAVVWLPAGTCGTASPHPGIYLIDPNTGHREQIWADEETTTTSAVALWTRIDTTEWVPPQTRRSSDALLPVDDFNTFIDDVRPAWALDPAEAALAYLGLGRRAAETAEGEHRTVEATVDRATVTITNLADDSVYATRTSFVFAERHDLPLQLVEARWSQQCWAGRGHQDFTAEPCI